MDSKELKLLVTVQGQKEYNDLIAKIKAGTASIDEQEKAVRMATKIYKSWGKENEALKAGQLDTINILRRVKAEGLAPLETEASKLMKSYFTLGEQIRRAMVEQGKYISQTEINNIVTNNATTNNITEAESLKMVELQLAKTGVKVNTLASAQEKLVAMANKAKESFLNFGKIMMAAFAVDQLMKFAEKGADAEQVMTDLNRVMAQFGKNATVELEKVKKASAGLMDDSDIAKVMVRASKMGVPIDAFAKLMEIARVKSREFGGTVAENFEKIVDGIGTGRTKGLVYLQLLDQTDDSLKKVKDGIEEEGDAIVGAEIKQARLNKVLENGTKALSEFNTESLSNKEKLQQLKVMWEDIQETIGIPLMRFIILLTKEVELFGRAWYSVALGYKAVFQFATKDFLGATETTRQFEENAEKIKKNMKEVADVWKGYFPSGNVAPLKGNLLSEIDKPKPKVKTANEVTSELEKELALTKEYYEYQDLTAKEYSNHLKRLRERATTEQDIFLITKAQKDLQKKLNDDTEKARDKDLKSLDEKQKKLNDQSNEDVSRWNKLFEEKLKGEIELQKVEDGRRKIAYEEGRVSEEYYLKQLERLLSLADTKEQELEYEKEIARVKEDSAKKLEKANDPKGIRRQKKEAILRWREENETASVALDSIEAGLNSLTNSFLMVNRQAKDGWDAMWIAMENTAIQAIQRIAQEMIVSGILKLFQIIINPASAIIPTSLPANLPASAGTGLFTKSTGVPRSSLAKMSGSSGSRNSALRVEVVGKIGNDAIYLAGNKHLSMKNVTKI